MEFAPAKNQTVNNMKRLFLTFGLVIAFFFTAQLNAQTIFDTSSYQSPLTSLSYYFFDVSTPSYNTTLSSASEVESAVLSLCNSKISASSTYNGFTSDVKYILVSTTITCQFTYKPNSWTTQLRSFNYQLDPPISSVSCPPESFPIYSFERDTNSDGKADQCFNPDELDNASNCANQVGNMLPALTNLATKVCKTDPTTGASCGYSKQDGDIVYKTDLEMNCFGDGEEVPEYDPEPMPEPETCVKYNDGLMVCKGDPSKCDALGNCGDQCGFVNGELYCFEQCSGAECDQETPPPVNCETNPTAPVCVEEPDPDPEFCAANPTDPKCVDTPEPCTGADCPPDGGGGGTSIDLKPVVDELKGLNTKLDFTTSNNASTRNMGLLETAFDDESISELKSKTDDIKSQINSFYTSTKAEISSMFSFSTGGGAYEPITFAFTYGTYSSKIWEYFSQNVAYIAAAIMFLAYLMAARIVLE